jgi:hypothetical protein
MRLDINDVLEEHEARTSRNLRLDLAAAERLLGYKWIRGLAKDAEDNPADHCDLLVPPAFDPNHLDLHRPKNGAMLLPWSFVKGYSAGSAHTFSELVEFADKRDLQIRFTRIVKFSMWRCNLWGSKCTGKAASFNEALVKALLCWVSSSTKASQKAKWRIVY